MFDPVSIRGFVTTFTVHVPANNAAAAKALMVEVATKVRDRVIGGDPKPTSYLQFVDGRLGADLTAVRPDGVIVFAWQYLGRVVEDTYRALVMRSPYYSGEYIAGLLLLVDGNEAGLDAIDGNTKEVLIVASVPYARKLEVGKRKDGTPFSIQVKPHIVKETAIVARKMFGSLAEIRDTFVNLTDPYILVHESGHRIRRGKIIKEMNYPAIRIRPRQAG